MSRTPTPFFAGWTWRWSKPLCASALVACLLVSCGEKSEKQPDAAPVAKDHVVCELRLELARHRPPEQALLLLAENLAENSDHAASLRACRELLIQTTWQIPEAVVELGQTVDHLWADSRSVWVAVSNEKSNTAIRWSVRSGAPPSVLFPADGGPIRSWHFSADATRVLIDRSGLLILCDAQTLKPIRALPPLPPAFIPASVVCFSREFPIFAHPSQQKSDNRWHIRDAVTGEEIRAYDPPSDAPSAIAARMAGSSLQLLHADGRVTVIPTSPAESAVLWPASANDHYAEAIGHPSGFLALAQRRPHDPMRLVILEPGQVPRDHVPTTGELLTHHPHTRQPSLWTSALPWPEKTSDAFTAKCQSGNQLITADSTGRVLLHRILPPAEPDTSVQPASPPLPARNALDSLLLALGDVGASGFPRQIDTAALRSRFPDLSFDAWSSAAYDRPSPPEAAVIRATLDGRLERFSERPVFPEIEDAFADGDEEKVFTFIDSAGPSGAQAAICLQLALSSTRPGWLARCLDSFTDPPSLLARLARSRIDWLENRRADAIAAWPEPFPDYDHIRRSEDWDGWEAADFRVAFEHTRQSVNEELARLVVPDNATREQRDALYLHLTDEAAFATLGRARYARACLDAATSFAAFPDETERTFELAKIARAMGAPPVPCLRAEALALSALQDHARARDRWVELITHHPISDHQPGDYAEAAYSAFENQDSGQAMAILATGMHRYPQDSAFALRAAWIALLTAHPEAAYRFLLAGHRVGWPEEQAVPACALLAIAAYQSGAPEESAAWFDQLLARDASWREETTIAALGWPEELTSVLHQLGKQALVTPDP